MKNKNEEKLLKFALATLHMSLIVFMMFAMIFSVGEQEKVFDVLSSYVIHSPLFIIMVVLDIFSLGVVVHNEAIKRDEYNAMKMKISKAPQKHKTQTHKTTRKAKPQTQKTPKSNAQSQVQPTFPTREKPVNKENFFINDPDLLDRSSNSQE